MSAHNGKKAKGNAVFSRVAELRDMVVERDAKINELELAASHAALQDALQKDSLGALRKLAGEQTEELAKRRNQLDEAVRQRNVELQRVERLRHEIERWAGLHSQVKSKLRQSHWLFGSMTALVIAHHLVDWLL